MGFRLRIGTGNDEAVLRLVGQGGPDFLAVENPLAAGLVKARLAFHIGQVGTGGGLGIALAPELLAGADARQVALLLRLAAKGNQRGTGERLADMPNATGAAGTGVLFVEDHLLLDARAATTVLLGPADAGPAALGQLLLPGFALLDKGMLVAGATAEANRFKLAAQVLCQPTGDFLAELFVFGTETQFHAASPSSSWRARRSRCQAASPSRVSLDLARLK